MDRRRALLVLGTLGAAPGLAASSAATPPQGLRFEHGVASGDPLTDSLIIWTRLSGATKATEVRWDVATDADFGTIIRQGRLLTDAGRDYTVKVDVTGLEPDTPYFYRFSAGDVRSGTGRAQTLPLQTDKVVLAVVSCALHSNGFFNAYRAVADLERVDCVVHLGDYIYEYGAGLTDYGMGNGRMLGRIPEPAHEIVTLRDYRTRHAQYKRDDDLQAAHARAAWICVFDDHEICNNPWMDGAQNHNPDKGEGDWLTRKACALRAYSEWMPIREPAAGQLSEAIYRSFRFGQLAELVMVETRLIGRSKQLDFAKDMKMMTAADGTLTPDFTDFRRQLNDPSREIFGAEQRKWLQSTLSASVRDGVRWQVLGNQVVMARIAGPDIRKLLGPDVVNTALAVVPQPTQDKLKAMSGIFSQTPPLPFNLDAWDGYPVARERFYDLLKATGAR
ncbi:MAG: alkaline phosphatase D family protein, partial [Asticcacaulis sp.]